MRISRFLVVSALLALVPLPAQEALNPPSPFVPAAAQNRSAASGVVTLAAAQRAQELGFPSVAAVLYRELRESGSVDPTTAMLGLTTALIDEGRFTEAEKVLNDHTGPRDSAWNLRAGLVAMAQKQLGPARTALMGVRGADLMPEDRSWWHYLQAIVSEAGGDSSYARTEFGRAEDSAVSAQAKARFQIKRAQAQLKSGVATEAMAEAQRRSWQEYQGRKVGYEMARTYATTLDALGRTEEAITLLQREISTLPAAERAELDDMRLLLGLIAGAQAGAGRAALEQLLERGSDLEKQRIALHLLARASAREPQRSAFRAQLDRLVEASPVHPALEDLLLFRAEVALSTKTLDGYSQAEEDARTLLARFPGSPLKPHAYGVLTQSAWEQRRYRSAADNASKARAELSDGAVRGSLGVLVAEAWYRARDFRAAADAYAAALREVPAGVSPGELMFQRVQAEIEADAPEPAARVLDEMAADPAFDPVSRWQAEWNLARALQVRGQTAAAFARVQALLSGPLASRTEVPPELRARMAWLQAKLASESGQADQALQLVDRLAGELEDAPASLRSEIASAAGLLRAQALFALKREREALEELKRVRADFPRSDAAVYSYFDEADYYARQDNAVEAQQLLTKLAEDFPDHPYAPMALLQAALQAERRGQDSNLVEANRLIEDLVRRYPNSELVFAARLRQGDLLRRLNQYPQAQRAYEDLVNKYSQREDVALAQLALAQCHNAQSATQPAHAESALVLFEHVRDRVDAPLDARVEAGYNLGRLLARLGRTGQAEAAWWRDVVHPFLLDATFAEQLGEKGRYWMTRTLLELGGLFESQEKLEQAKEAWSLILRTRLPGENLARSRLARYGIGDAK